MVTEVTGKPNYGDEKCREENVLIMKISKDDTETNEILKELATPEEWWSRHINEGWKQ